MVQVGLGLSPVAAVAHAVAAGELADGALDAGPDGVALVPGGVLLVGAVAGLQLVELARGEADARAAATAYDDALAWLEVAAQGPMEPIAAEVWAFDESFTRVLLV